MKETIEIRSVGNFNGRSFLSIYGDKEIKFIIGSPIGKKSDVLFFCLTGFVVHDAPTFTFLTKE